ncbi:NADH-quinone oxidoreductase subunit 5 family protein [Nostocoides jenkinsii]|uniref:NADH dehydrogenase subunit n=1 Tax=Nostocoides jenkinsii Ben 74 TaxID=1193518 RepID=A0A077MCA3_9MICO|nr:proton-conducting transporter membrane subunit [Tetrasphaera jenkinsii]CCI54921.1 NADH dehydrogenase subunit [Tetrasphaera jenkinsii Ben 74]
MTGPIAVAWALLVLVGGAPLILGAGLVSRRLASGLAQLLALVAAGLGVVAVMGAHGAYTLPVLRTAPPGASTYLPLFPARLATTSLVATIAATVLLVVLAVQVFAASYLDDDDRRPAFQATVSLFAGAMLLLVVSRDLVLTLVGWEVMGWCSYLLIGHWSRKAAARRAAYKAFLVTRLADAAFVIGIVALIAIAGSSDYGAVVQHADGSRATDVAMTALVIGVLGKSAQIPFQDWLIDAMEGPTPASALIHAATMVAAGTWVLTRLAAALHSATVASWVLACATAATMSYAAFTAFLQTDVKRILAWSTISQVGVMLSPLAVAETAVDGQGAAAGHLFSHAIFKALLFLTVGWLAVLAGSTAARDLSGVGATSIFATAVWGLGLVSLAGVPFTVGGLSKEHVIAVAAWTDGDGPGLRQGMVTAALLVTVAMTAAYATRAFLIVARPRTVPGAEAGPAPRTGLLARATLVALAVATLAGGLVFLVSPLDPGHLDLPLLGVSVVLIATGVLVGLRLRPDDAADPAPLMTRASRGWGADAAYVAVVAKPVLALARVVAYVDREIIESYVRAPGWVVSLGGRTGVRAHAPERVSTDLLWVVLGLLVMAGVALWG